MKKIIYITLIVISLLCFCGLIYMTIKASELDFFLKTVGFIILGYFCIALFAYSWMKMTKR